MSRHQVAFLIDTSVWVRDNQPTIKQRLHHLSLHEDLWTSRCVDLEVLFNSRSRDVAKNADRRRYLKHIPITSSVMERSVDIVEMANSGLHRHGKPMDLIIAAAAESEDLTVLHYDRDFDHIASVTGQGTEWVAPPGTLD